MLVHGTNDTSASVADLAGALRRDGRAVTLLDYGRHRRGLRGRTGAGGLGPLPASTLEVLEAVRGLVADLDAPYVDLIGHSQGGLHVLGCAAAMPERVTHAVLLGTPLAGLQPLGPSSRVAHVGGLRHALDWALGPSVRDMIAGSGRLPDLADLPPGPRYLLLASTDDRLVPPGAVVPARLDHAVRVVWVQDVHPGRRVSHTDLVADPLVYNLIRAELDTPR